MDRHWKDLDVAVYMGGTGTEVDTWIADANVWADAVHDLEAYLYNVECGYYVLGK